MHFLKRSGSCMRLRVTGQFLFAHDEFQKALTRNAFREFSDFSEEVEESIGWVSPENCLESPQLENIMLEPYFKLMMRVDRRKISKTLMSAHLAIEEKAFLQQSGKRRLTRQERIDIKNSVRQLLLPRASISSVLYRALWNFRNSTCILFSTSQGVQKQLSKLFFDTFDLQLTPLTSWALAEEWSTKNNVRTLPSLTPSNFRVQEE